MNSNFIWSLFLQLSKSYESKQQFYCCLLVPLCSSTAAISVAICSWWERDDRIWGMPAELIAINHQRDSFIRSCSDWAKKGSNIGPIFDQLWEEFKLGFVVAMAVCSFLSRRNSISIKDNEKDQYLRMEVNK